MAHKIVPEPVEKRDLSEYALYSDCCDDKIATLFGLIHEPVLKRINEGRYGPEMYALLETIGELFGHAEVYDLESVEALQCKAGQWLRGERK